MDIKTDSKVKKSLSQFSEEELKQFIQDVVNRLMSEKEKQQNCELLLFEDPVTGDWIVQPRGRCSKEQIEQAKEKIKEKGVVFPKYK